MKLSLLLGNGKKVCKKGKLGVDGYSAQRTKEDGNILGSILRLYPGGVLASLAFALKECAAVGQIKLATACIHDKQPRRGSIRTFL
jgi:hypothetical protein